MRLSDKSIQTVHFSAMNIQMKVEKAKLRCEVQISGKNLRQWRREINKIIKSMNQIDKEGKKTDEKTASGNEGSSSNPDGGANT